MLRGIGTTLLDPIIHPYAGAIGDTFILQADNARLCTTRFLQQYLEAETIV